MFSNIDESNILISTISQMKEIPKTLILIPDLKIPGGVSNYYKTLKLDAYSNITYFTINKEKAQSATVSIGRLFIIYNKFFFKIIRDRYKVIVINPSLDEGKSFHRDMLFIIISHLLNRKTIVFFRGWFDPYEEKIKNSRFKSFLFRISYAKVDKYIVLGNIFKKKLRGLGVPSKTEFFIETTVADSSYLGELSLKKKYLQFEKEIQFLFLSRIEKEKGVYIAIDAFREFSKNYHHKKSSLIIAGDGRDLPEVKEYVEKEKISNIIFLGHVSSETKKKVLLESHVMIFPSFTEGLPNVILEGMLYGMPIVSRAVGGIPEVVVHDINGYLTESYDSSIFSNYLAHIASDNLLYKNIAEKNHYKAVQNFTNEKVKERIIKIYEDS